MDVKQHAREQRIFHLRLEIAFLHALDMCREIVEVTDNYTHARNLVDYWLSQFESLEKELEDAEL